MTPQAEKDLHRIARSLEALEKVARKVDVDKLNELAKKTCDYIFGYEYIVTGEGYEVRRVNEVK